MFAAERQSIKDAAIARAMKDRPFRRAARANDDDLIEGDRFWRKLFFGPANFEFRFRNQPQKFEKDAQPGLDPAHYATRSRKGFMSAWPQ